MVEHTIIYVAVVAAATGAMNSREVGEDVWVLIVLVHTADVGVAQ
jgi:hypothetical protein